MAEIDVDKYGQVSFHPGIDYLPQDYEKWKAQIALWISKTQKNKLRRGEDPLSKAEKILKCAVMGTTLKGTHWRGIERYSLRKRIIQFCGWDIKTEMGKRYNRTSQGKKTVAPGATKEEKEKHKANQKIYDSIKVGDLRAARDRYKTILIKEFPQIDNPVYDTQVSALAESVVKLNAVANDFLLAEGSKLESLIKIRDGLKKDIDDFQKQLKIHPSQIKDKVDDIDKGDIGSLIKRWESYGEISDIYEKVDAIQELIQTLRQVEQIRVDGSPQLADYLLYHKTGSKPYKFRCSCSKEWEIYNGFTKEELYAAAEQAYKVFGFGLEPKELKHLAPVGETEET